MSKTNDYDIIKCPNCKAEYLISEIYLPNSLLGHPKSIIKDNSGQIENCIGEVQDRKESYICDFCDKKFNVLTKFTITTKLDREDSIFDSSYSTKIKAAELELKEE